MIFLSPLLVIGEGLGGDLTRRDAAIVVSLFAHVLGFGIEVAAKSRINDRNGFSATEGHESIEGFFPHSRRRISECFTQ